MDKDSCRKEFYKVKTGGLIELSQFIPGPDPWALSQSGPGVVTVMAQTASRTGV